MNDFLKKRMENILAGRPLKTKEKKPLKKVSDKRAAKEKEQKEMNTEEYRKEALEKWFSDIAAKHSLPPMGGCPCMECGEWIEPQYMRHATAHLLPKKLFKSVATHELNYLILGASCGCHTKTDRVDKLVQMKVWPEAKRRILVMLPLLPHDELKYISEQLDEALNNY